MANATLIPLIDALLPQTQCGQCGHPGCAPYAQAIADGEAINHCVPGGQSTIDALARLLDKPSLPLDPAYGVTPEHRLVAFIREDECIGCDLCVAPCPVDCIDMVEGPDIPMTWHKASDEPLNADEQAAKDRADKARERFETLKARQAKLAEAKAARRPTAVVAQTSGSGAPDTSALMIAAALALAKAKAPGSKRVRTTGAL